MLPSICYLHLYPLAHSVIEKDALLNLLSEYREDLVGDVAVGDCLGNNDHEIVEFKSFDAMREKKINKIRRVAILDFKRAHFRLSRELVKSVP